MRQFGRRLAATALPVFDNHFTVNAGDWQQMAVMSTSCSESSTKMEEFSDELASLHISDHCKWGTMRGKLILAH